MEPVRLTDPMDRNSALLYYGQDVRATLKQLPDASVHAICTSPPYFGLRDYNVEGQIGLEESPEEYVKALVEVMQEARRVLRDDGTLWLNLGDSYATNGVYINAWTEKEKNQDKDNLHTNYPDRYRDTKAVRGGEWNIKAKDLMGIPWRVAFALQADGWYLRSDIIWAKKNPLPERVLDRPTKSHEYIFLLTKQAQYFYDLEGGREPAVKTGSGNLERKDSLERGCPHGNRIAGSVPWVGTTRNRRSVWTISLQPFKGAHFATFPVELVSNMIKSGTSGTGCCPSCGTPWQGDAPICKCPDHTPVPCTVLDIFSGSATTGMVAWQLGRNYIGVDLNSDYLTLAQGRLLGVPAKSFEKPEESPLDELW